MAATYWAPHGRELTQAAALMLAVPAMAKPTQADHWRLWRAKMQALVLADPVGASQMLALARLDEKTLDLWWICKNEELPQEAWVGLIGCESTQHLRRMIEWEQPGEQVEPPVQTLLEILVLLQQ